MHRTTIMLPESLKSKAVRRAKKLNLSLGELIREALEMKIRQTDSSEKQDSLFADDIVYSGRTAVDISTNHDDYLYEE